MNPRRSRILTNLILISTFSFLHFIAAFCRVLASVCEAKLCLCVQFPMLFRVQFTNLKKPKRHWRERRLDFGFKRISIFKVR